ENGAVLQIRVNGAGKITIPLEKEYRSPHLYAEGGKPGSRGKEIPCTISGNALMFEADGSFSNRWLYLTGE
ncbi:MAG TPA: hypothetical protein PLZ55_10935, partial [bacterium]|nr:hypothetical protein [bacterium]